MPAQPKLAERRMGQLADGLIGVKSTDSHRESYRLLRPCLPVPSLNYHLGAEALAKVTVRRSSSSEGG